MVCRNPDGFRLDFDVSEVGLLIDPDYPLFYKFKHSEEAYDHCHFIFLASEAFKTHSDAFLYPVSKASYGLFQADYFLHYHFRDKFYFRDI